MSSAELRAMRQESTTIKVGDQLMTSTASSLGKAAAGGHARDAICDRTIHASRHRIDVAIEMRVFRVAKWGTACCVTDRSETKGAIQ
jgi:hypothetical protein